MEAHTAFVTSVRGAIPEMPVKFAKEAESVTGLKRPMAACESLCTGFRCSSP